MPCYIHLYSLHLSLGYSTKAYPEMRELDRFQNHHISIKYTQILEDWSLSEVLNIFPDQSVSPFSSSLLYCIILLYPLISRISKSSKYPTWCSTLSHDFTGKVKELSRSRRPLVSAKVDWKITSTCRGFLRCRCKPSGSEMMSSKETWLNQQRWWSNQEKKALFNQQRFRCNWRKTEMQPTKKWSCKILLWPNTRSFNHQKWRHHRPFSWDWHGLKGPSLNEDYIWRINVGKPATMGIQLQKISEVYTSRISSLECLIIYCM